MTVNIFDEYTTDEAHRTAQKTEAAALFEALPTEIQRWARAEAAIERQYKVTEGYYDRTHSHNTRLGIYSAKIKRASDAAGLNYAMVLWTIGTYFAFSEHR
jgi:hypothetical protein